MEQQTTGDGDYCSLLLPDYLEVASFDSLMQVLLVVPIDYELKNADLEECWKECCLYFDDKPNFRLGLHCDYEDDSCYWMLILYFLDDDIEERLVLEKSGVMRCCYNGSADSLMFGHL